MRILGFSRKDWINYLNGNWKREEEIFTTFRFTRRDRDWEVGELVQIVIKPRTKGREPLGIAKIVSKKVRWLSQEPMNKLTLEWVQRGGDK